MMGVTTTADERRDEAKEHLSKAYKALLVVMDEETWGHDEYSSEYMDTVRKVASKIMKWKSKL